MSSTRSSGADEQNVNPTQFSGGSRVIQYGLVSLRRMEALSIGFYAIALAIGLLLLAIHFSPALLVIGVVGIVLSVGYTAPPLKLVYRGLGEITTAIGFGPLMLLGAYVVQSGGSISTGAIVASIPVALMVMLILYVNEIPDRPADTRAGKRTLRDPAVAEGRDHAAMTSRPAARVRGGHRRRRVRGTPLAGPARPGRRADGPPRPSRPRHVLRAALRLDGRDGRQHQGPPRGRGRPARCVPGGHPRPDAGAGPLALPVASTPWTTATADSTSSGIATG